MGMTSDSLKICCISIASTLLAEGLSWILIYSKPNYKKLRAQIEKNVKALSKKKREVVPPGEQQQRRHEKKIQKMESDMRQISRDLSLIKFKSMFFLSFSMIALYAVLRSIFDGLVVAKLPFEPIPLLRKITHQSLPGDDFTDCSMTFLFIICSLGIRSNIQKMLGVGLPRGATGYGMFDMPKDFEYKEN
uniref:Calcium load-activated calcium channel n=1 Tax=Fibrocapsa japonica TaxID=94617 RepID=A0A7S2UZE6_9STRA|mmetsp:Transcript_21674/g.31444  ORF Transcript_21674/g.31444 Transcript_21674/m.31444 type:complete len:190 (+) Transcript_21674:49-618(+)